MGCAGSKVRPTESGVVIKDTGAFTTPDGEHAGKASWLYCPPSAAAGTKLPAVVLVHGMCAEGWLADKLLDIKAGDALGRDCDLTWKGLGDLAQGIAEQGIAVLMMGMPDHDEHKHEELRQVQGPAAYLLNAWPAMDYSKFLSAAIDHLCAIAPTLGVTIDTKRIGLVGHSMGGAGVLCAAAKDCKDKIAAVASLNPGHMSIRKPFDVEGRVEYFQKGAPFSGEHGEGKIDHLADVTVPAYVYGSQAEYNTELFKGMGEAPMFPAYPCVWRQLGSTTKELYVDNFKKNPVKVDGTPQEACLYAHVWFLHEKVMKSYCDGEPLGALLGFLRRHLAGASEARMDRPKNALEWE